MRYVVVTACKIYGQRSTVCESLPEASRFISTLVGGRTVRFVRIEEHKPGVKTGVTIDDVMRKTRDECLRDVF